MAKTTYTKADVIAMVRRRLGDVLTATVDQFVATGLTAVYPLSNYPCIASAYTVYVNGVEKTETTEYVMSTDGVVTFTVGNVPSAPSTISVDYSYQTYSDDSVWNFIVDGMPIVHFLYNFGYTVDDSSSDFVQNPSLPAGTCYALQAAILMLSDKSSPLRSVDGIMIKHGDETIDTKTPARIKQETMKAWNAELKDLVKRFIMYGTQPWLRP